MPSKVIISCAVTGSIHTPSMSDYLPITPEEIARGAIEAAEAGAAIIHLHARDPQTGAPTPDPAVFMRFLPVIKQNVDAVVNITTGGGLNMTLDERLAAPLAGEAGDVQPQHGQHELQHLPGRRAGEGLEARLGEAVSRRAPTTIIFRNTFRDIAGIVERLGKAHGTRFEFECYDVGHLYNLAYCLDQKIVEPPLFVQTIFGILGGIGADPRNLMFMRETADRLFGDDYDWSVLAAGRHQMAFTTMAGILGGNVRVGLEDQLVYRPWAVGEVERGAGGEDPADSGGAEPGDRHAERSARKAEAERRRPGWVLTLLTSSALHAREVMDAGAL